MVTLLLYSPDKGPHLMCSSILQNRDPPHLEHIRDFVGSFAKPAAWLQSRFSGVTAVIGQVCF